MLERVLGESSRQALNEAINIETSWVIVVNRKIRKHLPHILGIKPPERSVSEVVVDRESLNSGNSGIIFESLHPYIA